MEILKINYQEPAKKWATNEKKDRSERLSLPLHMFGGENSDR